MKKIICLLLPLAILSAGCTHDNIETTDVVDNSVSNTCSELNKDLVLLRHLAEKESSGLKYISCEDGIITFTDNSSVTVSRQEYSAGYINPTVGLSGGKWTVEGKSLSVGATTALLKIKLEKDVWKYGLDDVWTVLDGFELKEGEGVPVFGEAPVEAGDVVTVTLSSGDELSFEKYKGSETLTVSPSSVQIAAEGGTHDVTVKSNIQWTASCEAEWVTLSATSGEAGESTVSITAHENTDSAREATVVFTSASGELTASVLVKQKGAAAAGSIVLDSEDAVDTEDEDVVSNTVFDRAITIVWSSSGASVTGIDLSKR